MRQEPQKPKDNIISALNIKLLNKFINLKPSKNDQKKIAKEAKKVVDLLLAISRKDQQLSSQDIKLEPSAIQSNIELEKESLVKKPDTTEPDVKGADDILKPFLYNFIITEIDLEMISIYVKALASPELIVAIKALLKQEHDKEYQEFTMAASIDATAHYQEVYRDTHNGMSANDEEIKEFASLLSVIPLTVAGLEDLVEKFEEVIESEHERIEDISNEIENQEPSKELIAKIESTSAAPPPPKTQQIDIHDMLKKTFNKLDINNKKKFRDELSTIISKHQITDAVFGKALYEMCKDFDKLPSQKDQDKVRNPQKNFNIKISSCARSI